MTSKRREEAAARIMLDFAAGLVTDAGLAVFRSSSPDGSTGGSTHGEGARHSHGFADQIGE